ncbi:MAG: phosphoribosylanthranilate isomerase [Spirochaetia bacterium]|nr:phosphoribosylanthranilate isomerase [Spirochaetia bacterium]
MPVLKICGLTRAEDYAEALRLGVSYTGFIFYTPSPRNISLEAAKKIASGAPKNAPPRVGIFVNEDPEVIRRIFREVPLDIVQLHGDETPAYAKALALPYWKVIRLKVERPLDALKDFETDTFLIDAFHKDLYGGSGSRIQPELIRLALERGHALGKKIIVAGGVNAENISEILALSPDGVDVNSGVEKSPGLKDPEKMRALIFSVRGAPPRSPQE